MRNAERFVQIGVHDISAVIRWSTESYLRIQVRPIKIDLASMIVNQIADIPNPFFKDSIGWRVRDHDGGQFIAVFFNLLFQVTQTDIPIALHLDYLNLIASHLCTGRICAVSRHWDETNLKQVRQRDYEVIHTVHTKTSSFEEEY